MKSVRLALMLAAFLIMIAAVTNLLMIRSHGDDIYGVYLEIAAIGVIGLALSIMGYNDKRKKK
ncbi:MAG: hypothetical protein WBG43_01980 [Marinifilaceae bacterium]